MEDRGGKLELMLPYATLEPVRDLLLQYPIDPDRVCFVGSGRGGHAAWDVGLMSAERWANAKATYNMPSPARTAAPPLIRRKIGRPSQAAGRNAWFGC